MKWKFTFWVKQNRSSLTFQKGLVDYQGREHQGWGPVWLLHQSRKLHSALSEILSLVWVSDPRNKSSFFFVFLQSGAPLLRLAKSTYANVCINYDHNLLWILWTDTDLHPWLRLIVICISNLCFKYWMCLLGGSNLSDTVQCSLLHSKLKSSVCINQLQIKHLHIGKTDGGLLNDIVFI